MKAANKGYGIILNDKTQSVIAYSYSEINVSSFQFFQIFGIRGKYSSISIFNTICNLGQQKFVTNPQYIFFKGFVK